MHYQVLFLFFHHVSIILNFVVLFIQSKLIDLENGYYKIIQVHSATEFYGLSQKRENEFASLCQHLANYYNNAAMDPSFGATIFFDNKLYVIQNDNRYHRVLMM